MRQNGNESAWVGRWTFRDREMKAEGWSEQASETKESKRANEVGGRGRVGEGEGEGESEQ